MVIGIGLYLIFLDTTESDVLLNFSGGGLDKVVGRLASDIITYCVLLGYALNLMITYPMINWGLREVLPPCCCAKPCILHTHLCVVNLREIACLAERLPLLRIPSPASTLPACAQEFLFSLTA